MLIGLDSKPALHPRHSKVLQYVISSVVLAACLVSPLNAQQTITGRVTVSGSGSPLSGARVTIGDAAPGDTTRANGSYRLTLPQSRQTVTIRVTKIGFAPIARRITVTGAGTLSENFELEQRAFGLDATVITGSAGATQVREVGHSVAEIRPSTFAEPIGSVDQLLTAKIPGLEVIPSTGMAGGGAKIRLRGSASVALSNQPLVYIDGVRIRSDGYPKNAPFNDRSRGPNDNSSPLDDIDPGDIERVEVVRGPAATTLYGTEAAAGVIQIFTKRGEAGHTVWTSQIDGGVNEVQPFGPKYEPYLRLDPWLRRAIRAGYALSVGGGGDVRYHLASSFHRNEGVLPNDLEKRTSIRGNFDFAPAPNLTLAWSSTFTQDQLHNTPSGPNAQGLTQNAYRGPSNATGVEGKASLDRILAWDISTDLNHAIGGLTAVWTPGKFTSHTLTLGYDRAESEMRSLRPYGFVFAPQGILSIERWLSTTTTADYLGKRRFDLRSAAAATLAWGAQSIGTDISSIAGYGEGFAGPAPPTLSSAATTLASESRTRAVIAGAFTQATLDLRNRLFFTAGLRVDGSSSFGKDFGLQPFPRLGVSYVMSDEKYWPRQLGTFRLRAAYGEAGRAPRVFDADRTWIQAGYDGKPAYLPSSIGNSRLGPERSAETEVGFDASRADDRFRAVFTVYRRDTHDALIPVAQPPSLGFLNPQLTNVGSIRTSGLETALNGTLGNSGGISVDAGIDLSLNRTKVMSLGGTPPFVLTEVAWIREGDPAPVIIGTRIRNPSAIAEPDIEKNHVFGPNMPTRIIGVHSDLRLWGGARIGARLEYQGGNYLYDNASHSLMLQGVHPLCYAANANTAAGHPELLTAWERVWCNTKTLPGDGPIVRGDFIRLRDLSLTFPLRRSLMRASAATVTLAARNYLVWKNSDLKVFDPEMGGRDGMDAPVRFIELGVPPPYALSISIRATY
jgi:TonB-dependent starch-binding outer membrane protein SusC